MPVTFSTEGLTPSKSPQVINPLSECAKASSAERSAQEQALRKPEVRASPEGHHDTCISALWHSLIQAFYSQSESLPYRMVPTFKTNDEIPVDNEEPI